jgi:hypothetical protein
MKHGKTPATYCAGCQRKFPEYLFSIHTCGKPTPPKSLQIEIERKLWGCPDCVSFFNNGLEFAEHVFTHAGKSKDSDADRYNTLMKSLLKGSLPEQWDSLSPPTTAQPDDPWFGMRWKKEETEKIQECLGYLTVEDIDDCGNQLAFEIYRRGGWSPRQPDGQLMTRIDQRHRMREGYMQLLSDTTNEEANTTGELDLIGWDAPFGLDNTNEMRNFNAGSNAADTSMNPNFHVLSSAGHPAHETTPQSIFGPARETPTPTGSGTPVDNFSNTKRKDITPPKDGQRRVHPTWLGGQFH